MTTTPDTPDVDRVAEIADTVRRYEACAPAIEWTPARDAVGAYRVGHSLRPHVADGMTAQVDLGGGAYSSIPNPQAGHHGSIGWSLTWWADSRPLRLTAASLIGSYEYLLSGSISMTEATRRLRLLRAAWASLAKETNNG